jgi:hypothetical protein
MAGFSHMYDSFQNSTTLFSNKTETAVTYFDNCDIDGTGKKCPVDAFTEDVTRHKIYAVSLKVGPKISECPSNVRS